MFRARAHQTPCASRLARPHSSSRRCRGSTRGHACPASRRHCNSLTTTSQHQCRSSKTTQNIPVDAFHYLGRRVRAIVLVCEGVDVRRETRRRRRVDAGNVMIDSSLDELDAVVYSHARIRDCSYLSAGVAHALLEQMDQIRGAQLPQGHQRLGSRVNRFVKGLLCQADV